MDALLQVEAVTLSQNTRALRKLLDSINSHIHTLQSLGVEPDSYSSLLCPAARSLKMTGSLIHWWRPSKQKCLQDKRISANPSCPPTQRNEFKPPPSATSLVSGGTSCVNTPCCYCNQLHLPSNCNVVSQVEARKQADREHEAYALYTKSREILSHGSFNLRKFTTNAPSLQSIMYPGWNCSLLCVWLDWCPMSLKAYLSLERLGCFTDLQVALFWIRGIGKDWKPFVQNRFDEIQKLTPVECCNHCPGRENPADLPSRGLTQAALLTNQLWKYGPDWLKTPEPLCMTPSLIGGDPGAMVPVDMTSPRTRRHHRVCCRRHHTGLWTINYYFLFTVHVDVFCLTSYKKYASMPFLYAWRRPHWLKRVYNKSFGSLPWYTWGMFGLQLPTMFCWINSSPELNKPVIVGLPPPSSKSLHVVLHELFTLSL